MIRILSALVEALLSLSMADAPICVMVGEYKCAPIKVEVKCMTEDLRAGWWGRHQDKGCTWVVTLSETTRVEASHDQEG